MNALYDHYRRFEYQLGQERTQGLARALADCKAYIQAHREHYPIFDRRWPDHVECRSNAKELAFYTHTDIPDIEGDLMALSPWRKGPFRVNDIQIESEWDCRKKWARFESELSGFTGKRVLDIGANNGYFSYRLAQYQPKCIVALEPHRHYYFQALTLDRMVRNPTISIFPISLESFPTLPGAFERILNCGVFYHQKSPIQALQKCADLLVEGGQMIFETFVTDSPSSSLLPAGTYHDMPNVWVIPTVASLNYWLHRAGFEVTKTLDLAHTTPQEQAQTKWCPYPSYEEGLDANDSRQTAEGYPVSKRLMVVCRKVSPHVGG